MSVLLRSRARVVIRTIVVTLAVALATTGISPGPALASSSKFSDVPRSHQFHEEITWLAQMRVTTGYADGTFKPRDAVTREAFAAFLYRLTGSPQVALPSRSPFKDVPASAQFYKEIVWLSQQGITTGWGDGTFRPKDRISREAVAAFLYRLSGKPSFTAPSRSPFTDMTSRSKFYREVTWLASTRITTGWADGTFRPLSNVSREAIAAFLYRGSRALYGNDFVEYTVGKDIFPGAYVSRPANPDSAGGNCIWHRRQPGVPGVDYSEIHVQQDRARTVLIVLPTDTSVVFENCVAWVPLRATSPSATSFANGLSVVGHHMRPGTYQSPGGNQCEWRYWDKAVDWQTRVARGIDTRDTQRITVGAGHIVSSHGCGTWTRVGS